MRFASGPLYVSHSIPAKVEGEALALGKAEALAQHGSCVRTELATENCTKAPGIGPPITRAGGDGRKIHHKPRRTVTLRRPPAYLRGLEPTEKCPIRARKGKAVAVRILHRIAGWMGLYLATVMLEA